MALAHFPFYAGDWITDTLHLSIDEEGGYLRLLLWSWENGPLPDDPEIRTRILRVDEERAGRLWSTLSMYWQQTDAGLINPRLEHEREKAQRIYDQRVEASQRAATARSTARTPSDAPDGPPSDTPTDPPNQNQNQKNPTSSDDEGGEEDQRLSPDQAPLSHLLASLMVENGCRRPRVSKRWANEERRLLEHDGVDPGEAERVLRWCQEDEFWKANILSMPTFRKQYDRLRMKALGGPAFEDDGFGRDVHSGKTREELGIGAAA